MKHFKILVILLMIFILAGCNLKISLSPEDNNSEQSETQQESGQDEETETDEKRIAYEVKANEDGIVREILNKDTGEILTQDLVDLCGHDMVYYTHPQDLPYIILKAYITLDDDKVIESLYSLNLQLNKCTPLEVSNTITGLSEQVLSPDQTKIALVLEKDESRNLKLLDLVNDKSLDLVELGEEETLNGGYGGDTNHFDIKWLDNQMIQYTVYEDTFENYDPNAPENIEKVVQVRVISIK